MKSRPDRVGFFWDDPLPEPPRTCTPPIRTWEELDYLPYLEQAKAFNVSLFTVPELIAAQQAKEILICDTEVYLNYFLAVFTSLTSGKVIYFEMESSELGGPDWPRLRWILESFQIITFNGNNFDLPILALALAGLSTEQLKHAANQIIQQQLKPRMVLRPHKVKLPQCDHIDLIEVAPLTASLKIYGGRLHVPKMQELPFKESLTLTLDQIAVVRWYCINSDLTATAFLYMELRPQLDLRRSMSLKYQTDLRSKSDAQIAEAVIVAELRRASGQEPTRPEIAPGTVFRYRVPEYVRFETETLKGVLATVVAAEFTIDELGSPQPPATFKKDLKFKVGANTYQMGIGGMHSCEKNVATYADSEHLLLDRDVASYYPAIILNQGLYPSHLGTPFLTVYRSIVQRRLAAKKSGNKVEADSLKITANGSFGKFGSKYSVLYAPDLMLQVTMSGQLSLLMLVERLELAHIQVCSANTDGLLIRPHLSQVATLQGIIVQWERETGFITEETPYKAVFARDVNNYLALKTDGKIKVKGTYSERGSAGDSVLSKNPVNLICLDALQAFLLHGTPISATIRNCRDIRRFVSVRTVKGGAVKDGQYLGKAIRWYQSNAVEGEIIYAANGNKVPNSERCRPCMELPENFPEDVDFDRYEAETLEMLKEIGYT